MYVIGRSAAESAAPAQNGQLWVTWDDHTLYLAGRFEDRDLWARGEQDGQPHYKLGDVLEVFLKPALAQWYWELWVSPRGKKTSTFWNRQGEPGAEAGQDYHFDFEAAAAVEGTLNCPDEADRSWSFEVALPFSGLTLQQRLALQGPWTICLARQNFTGQVDLEHRELTAHPRLSRGSFHAPGDYARLQLDLR